MATITVRQHEKLIDRIKGLSELDLDQLLRDIAQHLYKNKQEHLIDSAFPMISNRSAMTYRIAYTKSITSA